MVTPFHGCRSQLRKVLAPYHTMRGQGSVKKQGVITMSVQRLRIGVVGCGAIAQAQHLPNLLDRPDLWEVTAVCDVSPGLVQAVGDRFGVPRRYTDYRALLAS